MADTFGADTGLARLGCPGPGFGVLLITCCCCGCCRCCCCCCICCMVEEADAAVGKLLTFELAAGLVGVALLLSAPGVFFSK